MEALESVRSIIIQIGETEEQARVRQGIALNDPGPFILLQTVDARRPKHVSKMTADEVKAEARRRGFSRL